MNTFVLGIVVGMLIARAMEHREQIRNTIRVFNKYILNRVLGQLAYQEAGMFALVQHVGRRSGKAYTTPILVQPVEDGFVIALTYGENVDWYKNVLAAGNCVLTWHSKDYAIGKIEPLDAQKGKAAFPMPIRSILSVIGPEHYVKMTA